MKTLTACLLAVHLTRFGSLAADDSPPPAPETVLATVGDHAITEADFQLFALIHNFSRDHQPPVRDKLLDQLIESQLIRQALKRHKFQADREELDAGIARIEDFIRQRKDDPDVVLKRLGLTRAALEDQLGLPLAWNAYVRSAVTDEQIEDYFQKHQAELDGTQLRASQILLKLKADPSEQDVQQRRQELAALRADIRDKKISFADAAKKHSEAPSKNQGGDIGWFPFRGVMPAPFCDVAFALKPGEISDPVVSPYGVALIQVTDRRPGEFTLDDVRRDVIKQLGRQLWHDTAATERRQTNITRR
ncbi:MAG: peptidylprolyl isomerase [Planctomycetaceae bacterium]